MHLTVRQDWKYMFVRKRERERERERDLLLPPFHAQSGPDRGVRGAGLLKRSFHAQSWASLFVSRALFSVALIPFPNPEYLSLSVYVHHLPQSLSPAVRLVCFSSFPLHEWTRAIHGALPSSNLLSPTAEPRHPSSPLSRSLSPLFP